MSRVTIPRAVEVPDRIRLARYARSPELGPRLLFFSGGTALRATSTLLPALTHNSVHLITPFDSGGSSAKLRAAFPMLAVGDLRNRMMALADVELKGHPAVYRLFATRLDERGEHDTLRAELDALIDGSHPLIDEVSRPLRRLIRTQLETFRLQAPADFDLRGASIGNLILAGGLLANDHDVDAVLFMFSRLVEVRGMVRPVVNENLHLAGRTTGGRVLVGQHQLTSADALGGEGIDEVWACASLDDDGRAPLSLDRHSRKLIGRAELIVYPIGSFFTSLMACLLPEGVGEAVAGNPCPKVYVPNSGIDPEQEGLSVADAVARLLARLRKDAGEQTPTAQLLNLVAVDTANGHYPGGLDLPALRALGVQILDIPMCGGPDARHDPRRLRDALLSIA